MGGKETKRVGIQFPNQVVDKLESEADERGLSRSEYLRRMISAGRRDLGISDGEETASKLESKQQPTTRVVSEDTLRKQILQHLEEGRDNPKPDEKLLSEVRGEIDDRIRDKLADLQEEGLVSYYGGKGYYITE